MTQHSTIQAIMRGEEVSDTQLIELERTLRIELEDSPLELSDRNLVLAYGAKANSLLSLVRSILELDVPDYRDIVQRQFEAFISEYGGDYNANQIRFLRAVKSVLAQRRRIERNDLYDEPFTSFGMQAVDRWFTPEQIEDMLEFAATLVA